MPKCDFKKVCPPVNLLHIFRMSFYKNSSGGQLLKQFTQKAIVTNIK